MSDDGQVTVAAFDPATADKEAYFTTEPYKYLYSLRQDGFIHKRKLEELADAARLSGCRTFKSMYYEYVKSLRIANARPINAVTSFSGQPLELETGRWIADEGGVYCESDTQTIRACGHPIMPSERIINIDTGTEKMKVAYNTGGKDDKWREHLADKSVIASSQQIVQLANFGVSVTSETAKYLVAYLQEMETMNYKRIPEKRSVGRMGWVDGYGFSPYVSNLVFDGDTSLKPLFDSVKSCGSEQDWMNIASEIRGNSIIGRVMLAASFASALVGPCGCLPFFLHVWGGTGAGKSVALMFVASVWACPVIGQYIQTFNSTAVSRERTAAFCNSMPLMIDELQLDKKDIHAKQAFDVYQLAEGVGKGRGTKTGGVERTATWANCIITTGENPLTRSGSGAGAVNRVVDIECKPDEVVLEDGHRIAEAVKQNYGFAGRRFVEHLTASGFDEARKLYAQNYLELSIGDTTEKQAMAAALLITADQIATDNIFRDDRNITMQEIKGFLATRAEASATERAYQWLMDWVSQNEGRFKDTEGIERYGDIDTTTIYINKVVFDRALDDAGYSSVALLSWLKQQKRLKSDPTDPKRTTVKKRIGALNTRYVAILIESDQVPLDVD